MSRPEESGLLLKEGLKNTSSDERKGSEEEKKRKMAQEREKEVDKRLVEV